ncbi:hypothetical protein DYB32_005792 [Aphanomyces invadans]|uniref:FYVE-type domain-containing protein n=1 Tax=Aphanomyces invadans TaxID=157072 RepID=A0A3R6V9K6_9STRA|nr:hypothetical protein DYB32_005792 [Aphanomyces invadans]
MAPPAQVTLPLPTNFFHTKALDARTQQSLLHAAQTCGAHLVRNAYAMDDHVVYAMHTNTTSQRRMKMTLGKDTVDPTIMCMIGHTQFHATLDDISAFFRRESLSHACHDGLVLDSHTLYTLATSTKDDPLRYTGVHWTAFKLPSPSNASRDFCYLEFTDPKTSKRGWLRVLHSVDVPACPSLLAPCGLHRSQWFRSGHVFIESGSGLVDCYAVLSLSGDASQSSAQMSFMRKWITQVMIVPNLFLSRRLASSPLVSDDELRPKDSVKVCMVCTGRFNLFNQKHHCRLCGHVVCSSCHITWKTHKDKVRICVKCAESGGGGTSMRESVSGTWNSSVASRGGHQRPPPVKEQADAHWQRASFSSDTVSITTKSGWSDDVVHLDCLSLSAASTEWDHPIKPVANYDHLFDFSVLRAPSTSSPSKIVLYAEPPEASRQAATSSRKTLYNIDLLADVPKPHGPPKPMETPPIDMASLSIVDVSVLKNSHVDDARRPSTDTNVALHELLEQMYDGKCAIVQSLYRDLVAQSSAT